MNGPEDGKNMTRNPITQADEADMKPAWSNFLHLAVADELSLARLRLVIAVALLHVR